MRPGTALRPVLLAVLLAGLRDAEGRLQSGEYSSRRSCGRDRLGHGHPLHPSCCCPSLTHRWVPHNCCPRTPPLGSPASRDQLSWSESSSRSILENKCARGPAFPGGSEDAVWVRQGANLLQREPSARSAERLRTPAPCGQAPNSPQADGGAGSLHPCLLHRARGEAGWLRLLKGKRLEVAKAAWRARDAPRLTPGNDCLLPSFSRPSASHLDPRGGTVIWLLASFSCSAR